MTNLKAVKRFRVAPASASTFAKAMVDKKATARQAEDLQRVTTFRVAQKVALCNTKGQVLIVRFSSNPRTVRRVWGKWDFPGGGVETGETMEEGFAREIREEIGRVRIKIGELLTVADWVRASRPLVRTVCLFYAGEFLGGEIELNEEHDAYKWVKPKDLKRYDWMMPDLKAVKKVLEVFDESS